MAQVHVNRIGCLFVLYYHGNPDLIHITPGSVVDSLVVVCNRIGVVAGRKAKCAKKNKQQNTAMAKTHLLSRFGSVRVISVTSPTVVVPARAAFARYGFLFGASC